jgi:group II intron reverse transcriptase/maturase
LQTPEIISEALTRLGKDGKKLERGYRLLYNPELYLRAYGKIYRNEGAMTQGTDPETADRMSKEKIGYIIDELKREHWIWRPNRRVEIPKANGKKRKLGIPNWSDKILQEILREILEHLYEPQFSSRSHGFRPNKGCHTALEDIQKNWTGTKWFIEGDIKGCFDNIDHGKLLEILEERVDDNRLIRLIGNLLGAGYMEDWQYHASYSGTPQGGVISPILSNIYLDKLDKYVERVLIPRYTRGKKRMRNKVYESHINKANYLDRAGKHEEARKERQKAKQMPSADPQDPNFRRLNYVRYADDFLLGFIGPKEEAAEIKESISMFLIRELKLEMSQEKTLITHAEEGANFLGYLVKSQKDNSRNSEDGRRHLNGKIGLKIPEEKLKKYVAKYQLKGKPIRRTTLMQGTDYEIIRTYNDEFRGICQYYKLAYDVSRLSRVKWEAEKSLTMTLAGKHKITAKQVYQKYRREIKGVKALVAEVKREGRKSLIATWGTINPHREPGTIHDVLVEGRVPGRSELQKRLEAETCEACGKQEKLEVHHIRKLADLWKRKDLQNWEKIMAARKRKTMVLCRKCHDDLHAGRLQIMRSEANRSKT